MIMEYNLESLQLNLRIKYLNNIINTCDKLNIDATNVKKILESYGVRVELEGKPGNGK